MKMVCFVTLNLLIASVASRSPFHRMNVDGKSLLDVASWGRRRTLLWILIGMMIFFSDRLGSSCFLSARWGLTYVARLSLCLQYLSVEKTVIWFIISIVLLLKDWRKNRSKAIFMTEIKIFPLRIYRWWWSGKWWWNVPHGSKVWIIIINVICTVIIIIIIAIISAVQRKSALWNSENP